MRLKIGLLSTLNNKQIPNHDGIEIHLQKVKRRYSEHTMFSHLELSPTLGVTKHMLVYDVPTPAETLGAE